MTRIVDAQAGWAKPFGDFNHRWLSALFRPIRPIKDLLNGTWLGHPVHSAATDLPIGALTVSIVLDLVGQHTRRPTSRSSSRSCRSGRRSSTGLADYTDVDGTARMRATVHATVMLVAQVALRRLARDPEREPGRPDRADRSWS